VTYTACLLGLSFVQQRLNQAARWSESRWLFTGVCNK